MTRRAVVRSRLALLLALTTTPAFVGCECGQGTDDRDAGPDAARVMRDAYADDTDEEVLPDGGRAARDPERCRVEPGDIYLLGTDNDTSTSTRIVDVAANEAEFAAVWRERVEGFPQIRLAQIPSLAGAPVSTTLTDDASIHDEPAIAMVGGDYVVSWIDNSAADFEVFARPFSGGTAGTTTRLTNRVGRDDSPSLVTVGTNVVVSWVENRDADSRRVPVTRLLSRAGVASGSAHDVTAPANIGRPNLAPRENGAVLLYSETGVTLPNVSLQRLDVSGVPTGDPDVMSTEHNAAGDVDVGLTPADGAAVFTTLISGIRRDVRVRLLDGMGRPAPSEFNLTGAELPAEQGDSASVARLRQAVGWSEGCRDGYAVVYRSYPDGSATTVLRLILLDAGADVVRSVDLTIPEVSNRGGRTTVRIAGDGQLLVAWTDARTDRVDMRAARIRCD